MSNQWGSFFADAGTAQEGPSKDCDHHFNNVLDGFFVSNKAKERREMNTFWGDVIQKYSTITIPRIDFITGNFPPVWIMSMSIINVTQELSCFQMYNYSRTRLQDTTVESHLTATSSLQLLFLGPAKWPYIALEKSLVNAVTR